MNLDLFSDDPSHLAALDHELFGDPGPLPLKAWPLHEVTGRSFLSISNAARSLRAHVGYLSDYQEDEPTTPSEEPSLGGKGRVIVVPYINPRGYTELAVFGCSGSTLYFRNPDFIPDYKTVKECMDLPLPKWYLSGGQSLRGMTPEQRMEAYDREPMPNYWNQVGVPSSSIEKWRFSWEHYLWVVPNKQACFYWGSPVHSKMIARSSKAAEAFSSFGFSQILDIAEAAFQGKK